MKSLLNSFIAQVFGFAFILMFGAFFNWYPFFTGDTSVYLASGFENYVAGERPVFYGWFLRFSSLQFSLWIAAYIQCVLLAYPILLLLRSILNSKRDQLIVFLLICFGTGIFWESSKLIPDVFIAILALSLCYLLFFKPTRMESNLLWGLVLFSTIVHLSHLAVFTLIVLTLILFKLYRAREKSFILPAMVCLLAGYGALFTSNYLLEDEFTLSKNNSVFLLGKMNENGILDVYLEENCGKKQIALCQYKDSLPPTAWQFVWDKNGAVMKLGGWDANKKEHEQILNEIFTDPSYYPMLLFKSLTNTVVQISQTKVGDNLFRQEVESNSIQAIGKYYPHEKNQAIWTRQFLMDLPFNGLSYFYLTLLMGLILCRLYLSRSLLPKGMYGFLFLMLLSNAFITANLANIASRLNARLLWILPAILILDIYLSYRSENRTTDS